MTDREKWYEKTWKWIKKYWGIVLSAVALAVGYVIGRKQASSAVGVEDHTSPIIYNHHRGGRVVNDRQS